MTTPPPKLEGFEFYFAQLDTLVWVEPSPAAVVIHSSRATFSEARKLCFIRELAAEGFIPDDYYWRTLDGPEALRGVRWEVDASWLQRDAALAAQTRRFMVRLIGSAVLLWLIMMTALLVRGAG
jgi:hypothetical protein